LFDITLGFEADASGWENIYFRSYLQGETPQSIKGKVQEIADFSELGEFLDMPVRYYSAGMMIRLAFAVATAIEPEILIVDEVLAVGDLAFQQKATNRIRAMMAQARLMVIVSHDLDRLKQLCSRVIWMDHGSVKLDGAPADVVTAYQRHFHRAAA
jgi:ABC-type polysaccharide/polyol phosphate transport system ATPase subunit